MRIPSYLEYDEATQTVTICHRRTYATLMKIKLEASASGTMTRVNPDGTEDCDNYWIGVKPADSVVFEDGLFGRKVLSVKAIHFTVK